MGAAMAVALLFAVLTANSGPAGAAMIAVETVRDALDIAAMDGVEVAPADSAKLGAPSSETTSREPTSGGSPAANDGSILDGAIADLGEGGFALLDPATTPANLSDPAIDDAMTAVWGGAPPGESYWSDAATAAPTDPESAANGPRLRDLLRIYTNVAPKAGASDGGENRDGGARAAPISRGGGLLNTVLDQPADRQIAELVGLVFQPMVTNDGNVSFSLLGLGNFAVVLSDDRSRLRVIDINSARAITLPTRVVGSAGDKPDDPWIDRSAASKTPAPTMRTSISDFIGQFTGMLFDPLKIGLLLIAILVWGAVRLRGHNA